MSLEAADAAEIITGLNDLVLTPIIITTTTTSLVLFFSKASTLVHWFII
jgi:hypothetical protein